MQPTNHLTGMGVVILIIFILYYLCFYIQAFLAYGTAYRKTKAGGDSGVALFGWMLVYVLAAIIPGLGFYLWKQNRENNDKK